MNNRTTETGILEIEYDENYWEFILNRILIFIDYFNKFIKSSEMKNNLLINGIENYEMDIYNSNFI